MRTSFLDMVRDASFGFPAIASSHLALSQTAPSAEPPAVNANGTRADGVHVNIGPVSLNVGGGAGNALEAGVDAARDGLRDLFGRVRKGVDEIRLS